VCGLTQEGDAAYHEHAAALREARIELFHGRAGSATATGVECSTRHSLYSDFSLRLLRDTAAERCVSRPRPFHAPNHIVQLIDRLRQGGKLGWHDVLRGALHAVLLCPPARRRRSVRGRDRLMPQAVVRAAAGAIDRGHCRLSDHAPGSRIADLCPNERPARSAAGSASSAWRR